MSKLMKWKRVILVVLILATTTPIIVHKVFQAQVNEAVNTVIANEVQFDPLNKTFVYVGTAKGARQELTQLLKVKGATIKDVRIGAHSFFAKVKWPFLGTYSSGYTFVAKNAATGQVVYPQ